MSRRVLSGNDLRQALMRGVNTLASAVTATLGPKGRTVILERNAMWAPHVSMDGVSVAKEIRDLEDPWENAGCHLIREAAMKTSNDAGDGTTTSTLLAQVIFQKGLECLDKGANPVALKRGIDAAVAVVVDHIRAIAQPVQDDETIVRVGMISSHGDRSIGELIAEAMRKVGRDGVIIITESSDAETTLQVIEGMEIDRGWLSDVFVNDPTRLEAVLYDPYILITERKLFTMTPEIDTLLAKVGQAGRPVLIVAGDYDMPFVVTLIHNNRLGVLKSVPVKAPAFGDLRRQTLEDMAVVTGGYAFTEDCGRTLSSATMADLGQADRVVCGQASTAIVGGRGDRDVKKSRMTLLSSLIESTDNDLDRERLRLRLARLASGVAVLKVGAVTEGEMRERKDRVDDAVCATKAAVEEGIVPGGGKALLSARNAIGNYWNKLTELPSGDFHTGTLIVYEALEAPLRKILANAGVEEATAEGVICSLGMPSTDLVWGYNAETREMEHLISTGVIDPAKVVRCALQNAASVAALMLTTEAMVATFAEKK
jgi:chaperonin GroEL